MNYQEQNASTGRVILPDLVRAIALMGIVVVNVAYIAYPGDIAYHAGGLETLPDWAAYYFVNTFFLLKSYTLFSFMFGVGLAYQIGSAERRGASFKAIYLRRMLGLIALGALHITVAFSGDILVIYGLLGILFYFFRNKTTKTLVRLGIAFIVLQVLLSSAFALLLYLLENFSPADYSELQNELQAERQTVIGIFSTGSLFEVAILRWQEWFIVIKTVAPVQAPGALAFFCFGLAAVRSGILSDPTAAFWGKARRVYLPAGVLLSAIGAFWFSNGETTQYKSLAGMAILLLASPLSSLGYIGLIAKWSAGPLTPFKVFLARGGSASLSAYLFQSLILSLLFCGYGFGLYQKVGALGCIIIALVTGSLSIVLASLWRAKHERGPMEFMLRRWSYLR